MKRANRERRIERLALYQRHTDERRGLGAV
jgi:hypothetical protein